jgi:hypothetical protein
MTRRWIFFDDHGTWTIRQIPHILQAMWLIPILCLVAGAFAAVSFGIVPPPHASTLLRVQPGTIRVTKGQVKPFAREHVREILAEAGVARGFIAITHSNRVIFSRHIPESVHQRLRNVLLNQ